MTDKQPESTPKKRRGNDSGKYVPGNRPKSANAREPVSGVLIDRVKFATLLQKYRGNLTKCADALGCSRLSLSRIVDQEPDMKSAMEDARERAVDMVEDTFTQKCIDGTDTTAGIFFLKTRGRHRGFDQELRSDLDQVMRTALSFALNKSKNPAENTTE